MYDPFFFILVPSLRVGLLLKLLVFYGRMSSYSG